MELFPLRVTDNFDSTRRMGGLIMRKRILLLSIMSVMISVVLTGCVPGDETTLI